MMWEAIVRRRDAFLAKNLTEKLTEKLKTRRAHS
jgi:hypothetical protein